MDREKGILFQNRFFFIGIWVFFVLSSLLVWKGIIDNSRHLYGFSFLLVFLWIIFIQERIDLAFAIWIILDIIFQHYIKLGRYFLYDTVYLGISQLLLILFFLYSIAKKTTIMEGFKIKRPFGKVWLLYIIFFLIGALRSLYPREGGIFFQHYALESCGIYFLTSTIFRKIRDIKIFIGLIVIFGILIGMLAGIEYFTGKVIIESSERTHYIERLDETAYRGGVAGKRIGSFFINPNSAAGFWTLLIPLSLALYIDEKRKINKIFLGLGVLGMLLALLVTFSRRAIFSFPIGVFFVLYMAKRLGAMVQVIVIFVITSLLLSIFYGSFEKMFSERAEDTAETDHFREGRMSLWYETIPLIKEKPFFGIGLGHYTYMEYGRRYKLMEVATTSDPHNSYLQLAVMTGLPCLFIFLWMLKRYFSFILQALKRESSLKPYLLGLTGGILTFLINSFFGSLYFESIFNHLFWSFIGISIALSNIIIESQKEVENK